MSAPVASKIRRPSSPSIEPADLLHPPDVQLQVRPARGQRVQAVLGAPGEIAAEVGLGVVAGGTFEPGQVGDQREVARVR